ncbi:MAG TPA: hypothetical protein VNH15_01565 [Elusimicrobiota bacterium]|nr:hypothetical protein [Elusimicrobiota bacterium]
MPAGSARRAWKTLRAAAFLCLGLPPAARTAAAKRTFEPPAVSSPVAHGFRAPASFRKLSAAQVRGGGSFSAAALSLLFDNARPNAAADERAVFPGAWGKPAAALVLGALNGARATLRIPPPAPLLAQSAAPDVFSTLLHEAGVFVGRPLDSEDRDLSRRLNQSLDNVLQKTPSGRRLVQETGADSAPIFLEKDAPAARALYLADKNIIIFNTLYASRLAVPPGDSIPASIRSDPESLGRYLLDHPQAMRRLAQKTAAIFFHEKTHQLQKIQNENCGCIEQEEQAFIQELAHYRLEALELEPKSTPIDESKGSIMSNLVWYAQDDQAFLDAVARTYSGDGLDDGMPLSQRIESEQAALKGNESGISAYLFGPTRRALAQDGRWNSYYQAYFAREHARWPEVSWETDVLVAEHMALGNHDLPSAAYYFATAAARAKMGGLLTPTRRERMQKILDEIAIAAPKKGDAKAREALGVLRSSAQLDGLRWPRRTGRRGAARDIAAP